MNTCNECKHYSNLNQLCKRYPPTAHVIGVDPMRGPMVMHSFPQVAKEEWCGEWKEEERVLVYEGM